MAKAQSLGIDALSTPQITPQAATPPRSSVGVAAPKPARRSTAKAEYVPLQVRIPPAELRAIRVAAAQRDMKLNEFMLECFRSYMKTAKAE